MADTWVGFTGNTHLGLPEPQQVGLANSSRVYAVKDNIYFALKDFLCKGELDYFSLQLLHILL